METTSDWENAEAFIPRVSGRKAFMSIGGTHGYLNRIAVLMLSGGKEGRFDVLIDKGRGVGALKLADNGACKLTLIQTHSGSAVFGTKSLARFVGVTTRTRFPLREEDGMCVFDLPDSEDSDV